MFNKKENGFSLVELAVAAAIATALAVVAVSVVTGTATSVSEKGSSAAAAETCTISESLKGGTDETINDCGTASSGSTQSGAYTIPANQFGQGLDPNGMYYQWSSVSVYGGLSWNPDRMGITGLSASYAEELRNIIENSTTITVNGQVFTPSLNTQADQGYQYTSITANFYGGVNLTIYGSTPTEFEYYISASELATATLPTVTIE